MANVEDACDLQEGSVYGAAVNKGHVESPAEEGGYSGGGSQEASDDGAPRALRPDPPSDSSGAGQHTSKCRRINGSTSKATRAAAAAAASSGLDMLTDYIFSAGTTDLSDRDANTAETTTLQRRSGSVASQAAAPHLPCQRCGSLDTKFCYLNNRDVKQPRHYCRGCQRYWTAGGTLRNVPVGSGRRKPKSSRAASSKRSTSTEPGPSPLSKVSNFPLRALSSSNFGLPGTGEAGAGAASLGTLPGAADLGLLPSTADLGTPSSAGNLLAPALPSDLNTGLAITGGACSSAAGGLGTVGNAPMPMGGLGGADAGLGWPGAWGASSAGLGLGLGAGMGMGVGAGMGMGVGAGMGMGVGAGMPVTPPLSSVGISGSNASGGLPTLDEQLMIMQVQQQMQLQALLAQQQVQMQMQIQQQQSSLNMQLLQAHAQTQQWPALGMGINPLMAGNTSFLLQQQQQQQLQLLNTAALGHGCDTQASDT